MVSNQRLATSVMFPLLIIVAFFFSRITIIQGIKLTGQKE
jgi:hypothetical protein